MTNQLPSAHSILGASGAYRWMKCPGSVQAARGLVDEPSEYAEEGSAAHALGEAVLFEDREVWQYTGQRFLKHIVTPDMVTAVQKYAESVRREHAGYEIGENAWIERSFHVPDIHEHFYGTCDFVYWDGERETLHVWDYKHGAGIIVEVENNSQLKYYAAGALFVLNIHNRCREVVLHVAQPRGWHSAGPIRSWAISAEDLIQWLYQELVPAMDRACEDNTMVAGEHCRFCPVRSRACPEILRLYEEFKPMAEAIEKEGAAELSDEQVAEFLEFSRVFKIALKAVETTAYNRLNNGNTVPGYKLASKRVDRQWKDGAEAKLKEDFGDSAFAPPKLATPAQVEKLPKGPAFVKRYAYKPEAGLTVVPADDTRPEVSKETKSGFKPVASKK